MKGENVGQSQTEKHRKTSYTLKIDPLLLVTLWEFKRG